MYCTVYVTRSSSSGIKNQRNRSRSSSKGLGLVLILTDGHNSTFLLSSAAH